MTLKSYEAIYDHGKLIWKDAIPDGGPLHLIVTVLPQPVDDEPEEFSYTEADIKWRYDAPTFSVKESLAEKEERILRERLPEGVMGISLAYGDDEPEYTEADIKWRYDQAT